MTVSIVSRALVLERQHLCRSGLVSIIEQGFRGVEVSPVDDMREALDALDAGDGSSLFLLDGSVDLKAAAVGGIRGLRRRYPQLLLVIMDARRDRDIALNAIADGAHGYIPKDLEHDDMLQALGQVMAGQVYVPPIVTDVDAELQASSSSGADQALPSLLTDRQCEVLTHMTTGKSNKEIARSLDISESTVKAHMTIAFRHLGVQNRVEAVTLLKGRGSWPGFRSNRLFGRRAVDQAPLRRAAD